MERRQEARERLTSATAVVSTRSPGAVAAWPRAERASRVFTPSDSLVTLHSHAVQLKKPFIGSSRGDSR